MFATLFRRPSYRTLNTITLSRVAVENNFQFFQNLQPEAHIAPVLKSNAYGHGLVEMGKILESARAPFLIVDSLYEAYQLQRAGIRTPVLIMGFTHPQNFTYKKLPFSTVVYDLEMIETLYAYQPQMSLHLKIDTGMNRQGVRWDELPDFLHQLTRFPNLKLEGLATHFSDADNPHTNSFVELQLQRFVKAIEQVEQAGFHLKWKHISASAGSIKIHHPAINLIRLGIGLYGISPISEQDPLFASQHLQNLQPVLQLETSIAQLKKVRAGETIGYNNTYTANREMHVAILPIGYYDGVDRRLSNKGSVLIGKDECPIVGRVSMNITTIDVSNVTQPPAVGQKVIVYSNQPTDDNSVANAAATAETIPYEIFVHLAESIRRVTL